MSPNETLVSLASTLSGISDPEPDSIRSAITIVAEAAAARSTCESSPNACRNVEFFLLNAVLDVDFAELGASVGISRQAARTSAARGRDVLRAYVADGGFSDPFADDADGRRRRNEAAW